MQTNSTACRVIGSAGGTPVLLDNQLRSYSPLTGRRAWPLATAQYPQLLSHLSKRWLQDSLKHPPDGRFFVDAHPSEAPN